jgi:hypothetical protein
MFIIHSNSTRKSIPDLDYSPLMFLPLGFCDVVRMKKLRSTSLRTSSMRLH